MTGQYLLIILLISSWTCSKKTSGGNNPPPMNNDSTFTNPLLASGPDPWVIQKDTNYYYTNTFGNRIAIYKTSKMSELSKAAPVTVWSPPTGTAYSKDIWAPELHYIQSKWYIYFAADDGSNATHRIYVLENTNADPLTSSWTLKGKMSDTSDKWSIDATVFEYNAQLYAAWSGWPGNVDGQQNIYIAKMLDPWTITGGRVMISTPSYAWEKNGAPPTVNEGPEVIQHSAGNIFLIYSASGCWTDDYALGMLSLKQGGDPMNAGDWTKSANPVFTKSPGNGAFGPGHPGFFKSRNGSEDWIIYHANTYTGQGCGDTRNPRMQKFTWNVDGTPNFGEPVKVNTAVRKPAGE